MALKFDKLKSLFIVSEEVENENEQKKEETKKNISDDKKQEPLKKETDQKSSKVSWKINSGNEHIETNNTMSETNTDGKFNKRIFEQLMTAIHKANLPGEDYLEFMEALQAMKDLPLDEQIKIQTVFATLSTKGLTAQKVFESADYYLKVLENEKTKFYEALKSQTSNQIGKKKKEIKKLEDVIKSKTEQIALLNEEINQSKQIILKIKNEMNDADSKIKKTENDFNFTFLKIDKQIRNTIEKVKAFTNK